MTEPEWLACDNRPMAMFQHVRSRLTARKAQLLAAAAVRLVWEHVPSDRLREAVAGAERFADGEAVPPDEQAALAAAIRDATGYVAVAPGVFRAPQFEFPGDAGEAAEQAVAGVVAVHAVEGLELALTRVRDCAAFAAERGQRKATKLAIAKALCDVFREVVGNPFRPWLWVPSFSGGEGVMQPDGATVRLSATARDLAAAVRAAQAFDRLPVLADALEESGVTDRELLDHCRHGTGHVRGCWALDVALGRV